MKGVDQLAHRLGAEGIAHLGPVDGDLGDTLGLVVENVVERTRRFPVHVSIQFDWQKTATSICGRI